MVFMFVIWVMLFLQLPFTEALQVVAAAVAAVVVVVVAAVVVVAGIGTITLILVVAAAAVGIGTTTLILVVAAVVEIMPLIKVAVRVAQAKIQLETALVNIVLSEVRIADREEVVVLTKVKISPRLLAK